MRLVLFDIDGTLLLGHGIGTRAMERAGRALLGPGFSLEGIDFAGALDPWIYRQAASRLAHPDADALHDAFHEAYIAQLARELGEPDAPLHILPGVAAVLDALAARSDLTLGLVTGNYGRAVPMKLRAVGIDPGRFAFGAYGEEAPTRPDLVRLALDRWGATGAAPHPDRAVVIGDTPRDVDCAHRNGCRCLAVATGSYTAADLRAAGADAVVEDLTDHEILEEWLGG